MSAITLLNKFFKYLFYPVVVLLAILFTMKTFGITIAENKSESLPYSFFVVQSYDFQPQKDELIYFQFEKNNGDFFYEDGVGMIKSVAGVPGDKIDFKDDVFYINGKLSGILKTKSEEGKTLTPNENKALGDDEYFVFSGHVDSFDSRYLEFGYVKKENIKGRILLKW